MNKNKGFTLIEILVVIGLIAILATIVLIAINPARQFRQANDSQRVSNVNAILNAVGQYIADHKGALPPNTDDGDTATKIEIKKTSGANICASLVPTYLPSLPVDPSLGASITDCTTDYVTKYKINLDGDKRITIYADQEEPVLVDGIHVTR